MADSDPSLGRLRDDRRGATPAVSKIMEVAIVVLYLGVVTTALYAGAIPEYRDAAGSRIGDRALASAAGQIENAVPAATEAVSVRRRVRVDLPRTIRGEGYRIRVENRTLVLDHSRASISGRLPLAIPPSVVSVAGRWSSDRPAVVTVEGSSDGLRVRLVRG